MKHEIQRNNRIIENGITTINECRMEDYRHEEVESDLDEEYCEQMKAHFAAFENQLRRYNKFMKEPSRDKKAFVQLKLETDEQLIENTITVKEISNIFFKICSFYRQVGVITGKQLIQFLTVEKRMPNTDDILGVINQIGIVEDNKPVNLKVFKKVLHNIKLILN